MDSEVFRRDGTVVRRQCLAPGEASDWHRDEHHRVTFVLCGQELRIEFRDGRPSLTVKVAPGQVDWDEPLADCIARLTSAVSRMKRLLSGFRTLQSD